MAEREYITWWSKNGFKSCLKANYYLLIAFRPLCMKLNYNVEHGIQDTAEKGERILLKYLSVTKTKHVGIKFMFKQKFGYQMSEN